MTGSAVGTTSGAATPSLAQIVAALSVTYIDVGVLTWLEAPNAHLGGRAPVSLIEDGRIAEIAEAVRRIGDADPADFKVVQR